MLGVWFIGPMYQRSVYRPSKNLLVPLITPRHRARDGTKRLPVNTVDRPPVSCAIISRIIAPLAASNVTTTPASQHAGNWRRKIPADEKSSEPVAKRDSRAPSPDHTSTGQINETPSTGPREIESGVASCATSKPSATAYHHQRRPVSKSRNSAPKTRKNAFVRTDPVNGVRCAVAVVRTCNSCTELAAEEPFNAT